MACMPVCESLPRTLSAALDATEDTLSFATSAAAAACWAAASWARCATRCTFGLPATLRAVAGDLVVALAAGPGSEHVSDPGGDQQ